ncbi:hypothetical protein MY4824_001623 [Beauveria thailandica]
MERKAMCKPEAAFFLSLPARPSSGGWSRGTVSKHPPAKSNWRDEAPYMTQKTRTPLALFIIALIVTGAYYYQ